MWRYIGRGGLPRASGGRFGVPGGPFPTEFSFFQTVRRKNEEEKREIEKENANIKRLPISIVLAFIGAVVGIIPSVISMFGFGYLFALLFAICPIASFFGYKLGKAPLRWYATLIAAVCSLVITALVVIGFGALIAQAANATLADAFNDPELGLTGLLAQALLFDGLGILCSLGVISKIRSGKVSR